MYSGKTVSEAICNLCNPTHDYLFIYLRAHYPIKHNQVEINNSDAEGRLVLSDAVAHATRHYNEDCNLVVDMATLTGAQLVSTGKIHAAILANTEELEQRAVKAGLASGDLCYPLLYAPELLKEEFNSKVRLFCANSHCLTNNRLLNAFFHASRCAGRRHEEQCKGPVECTMLLCRTLY